MTRRHALKTLAVALAGAAASRPFAADAWPARTVRIIVPFAPGGGTDTAARVLAEAFSPQLGHAFQKKSKSGISTPKPDVDLIDKRLKAVLARHGPSGRR